MATPGSCMPLFSGRFEERPGGGHRFAWSGSSITVAFSGTSLAVELTETGQNRYLVLLDGEQQRIVMPEPGRSLVQLVADVPMKPHVLTLYKLTEPLLGESEFHRFVVSNNGSWLLPPAPRERRMQIIGDSISTGYGNEGVGPDCAFSARTQNHYVSYGAIAARDLEADLVTLAWSGRGVFSNRGSKTELETISDLWERTLPGRADSKWSYNERAPDAVIINLGSNDFAPEVADSSPFAGAYERLLNAVRTRYPAAHLFAAVGPLLRDSAPPRRCELSTVREILVGIVAGRRAEGDTKVYFLEHEPTRPEEGWGCDYHPSVRTHARMAQELECALRRELGWAARAPG